jgi:hypothetical protein
MTVREIRVVAVSPAGGTETGGDLHGYALAVIGAAMLPLSLLRGSRAAGVALVALALAACGIVVFGDLPVLDDTGLIGRQYELAEAQAGTGFYVESAGAALALTGAVGALALSGRSARRAGRPRPASRRS